MTIHILGGKIPLVMNVLITSASIPVVMDIAIELSSIHKLIITDTKDVSSSIKFICSAIGHDSDTNDLVKGMDVIIHSGFLNKSDNESSQLDYHMRCTYNLLWAAWEEKVPRVVYLSSLTQMDKYEEDLAVTERWRPLPRTDTQSLSYHLGEYVCREFAREDKLKVVCLRLGDIVNNGVDPESSSSVYIDDVVSAIDKALSYDASGWDIFHVQSDVPNARYLTGQPWQGGDELPVNLGYIPRPRTKA